MQEVRIRVECVHTIGIGRRRLSMSKVQGNKNEVHKGRSRRRRRYWIQAVPVMLSAVVMLQVYGCLALLAMGERGYFAVGGEALAAIMAGIVTYLSVRGILEEKR